MGQIVKMDVTIKGLRDKMVEIDNVSMIYKKHRGYFLVKFIEHLIF